MTDDKPEAGRTCICDDEVPPRPSSCSMPAVAGKSYCERCLHRDCDHHWNQAADKPEAGRTCEPWCGRKGSIVTGYCSDECYVASRPLNPAPRPVEPRVEVVSEGPPTRSLAEILRDPPKLHLSPSPVERCSCPESTRYKAALEEIRDAPLGGRYGTARDIARRALALGGEET